MNIMFNQIAVLRIAVMMLLFIHGCTATNNTDSANGTSGRRTIDVPIGLNQNDPMKNIALQCIDEINIKYSNTDMPILCPTDIKYGIQPSGKDIMTGVLLGGAHMGMNLAPAVVGLAVLISPEAKKRKHEREALEQELIECCRYKVQTQNIYAPSINSNNHHVDQLQQHNSKLVFLYFDENTNSYRTEPCFWPLETAAKHVLYNGYKEGEGRLAEIIDDQDEIPRFVEITKDRAQKILNK